MSSYLDTASSLAQLLGTGFGFYSHHKQLAHAMHLHDHELSVSTEQHFSALSTDLLAIAKEADRDVWEQRNEQFNQMLVCAVLMFGIAVGNINEGTYQFDAPTDRHGSELRSLISKDGMFVVLSGMSISSLFICIVCCLLVMRRMSNYMIERSSNLVDRLAVSTGLAHQISGTAQQQSGEEGVPNFEEVLSKEKRRFHAKMGAAIGSGPREARQRHSNDVAWKTFPSGLIGRLRPERGGSAYGYVPPRPPPSLGERLPPAVARRAKPGDMLAPAPEETDSESSDSYQAFAEASPPSSETGTPSDMPPTPPRVSHAPPPLLHGAGSDDDNDAGDGLPQRLRLLGSPQAPLNFGIFYSQHCRWLAMAVTWSFVIGTLSAWSSVWFLLWNQFPHLIVPIISFAIIGLTALVLAGRIEYTTRKRDEIVARALRNDGLCAPSVFVPPSPHLSSTGGGERRSYLRASPPPSPPAAALLPKEEPQPQPQQQQQQQQQCPSTRNVSMRIHELNRLQAEGLLEGEEYDALRRQILAAL